jgi:hypothetical protein
MINDGILERLALRETGREAGAIKARALRRLVVSPQGSDGWDWRPAGDAQSYHLLYRRQRGVWGTMTGVCSMLVRLVRLAPVSEGIELYLFSSRRDRWFVLAAAITGRILGTPVTLHDYAFRPGDEDRIQDASYQLCSRLELGDATATIPDGIPISCVTYRLDAPNRERYAALQKSRSVPRVLVYGDFEQQRNWALAERAHDMIKQKYPRTEFILTSLTSTATGSGRHGEAEHSLTRRDCRSEDDLFSVFEQADIVLLLSSGGLNRCFACRAAAAGYPLICNGFAYPSGECPAANVITVDRDSYSGLADAIVRLVDDETYYRRLAAS